MRKLGSALALGVLTCQPAFADGMEYSPPRYYQYRHYLPPERHVIEVVQPPYSGNFIINGARFTAKTRSLLALGRGRADQARRGRLEWPVRRRGFL